MDKRIAAVVVTYNRKDLLQENIISLLQQEPEAPNIIVIDNHSTDGTKEAIQHYIDAGQIQYCDTGSNLGGAGGFSFGIRYAVEHNYDYIWLMDDDCIPYRDALSALLQTDNELGGNYGFLSSKVVWKDGSLCIMNLQRETVTKRIQSLDEELKRVEAASFVSLFLQKKTVLEIGLPIKEFFIWTDDWEYTRRISKKYLCYAVGKSIVVHKSKYNMAADISRDDYSKLPFYLCAYRNEIYYYRREGFRGFAYELLRLPVHCLRVLTRSPDHKKERLKTIICGTVAGFRFHPNIEKINEKV